MNKVIYYVLGIFIMAMLSVSVIYISHINRDVNENIGTNLSYKCKMGIENYTDRDDQLPFKIRGKPLTGIEGEWPIVINFAGNWYISVVFESNTTEKEAREIISKYDIPKPLFINRGGYPDYYVSVSRSDFEEIKKCLAEEDDIKLSNKIKIRDENVTAVIWSRSDWVLPGFTSSGILLKQTMTMELIYGNETPKTKSGYIMQQLDGDEKIINTNIGYLY